MCGQRLMHAEEVGLNNCVCRVNQSQKQCLLFPKATHDVGFRV